MKTIIKLCFAIIKKNKGFSIGILIMCMLSIAISFFGANLGGSSNDTIMNYLSTSGMPDSVVFSTVISQDIMEDIKGLDGIKEVSGRFIYDTNVKIKENMLFSVRVFKYKKDSSYKFTIYDNAIIDDNLIRIGISKKFAEYNNIKPGSELVIDTPVGEKEVVVESVISCPETLSISRDEMSQYESYQFAYVYIEEEEFNKIVDLDGIVNQFLIYFSDNIIEENQKDCMKKIQNMLGDDYVSSYITKDSVSFRSIMDDLSVINTFCIFIPIIVWFISIAFIYIFIKIVMGNQRNTIGLLRGLGFSTKKVLYVFIIYTLILCIPSIILGTAIGVVLLRVSLNVIALNKGISEVVVKINLLVSLLILVFVLLTCMLATVLSVRNISKVDPLKAYGEKEYTKSEPIKFIKDIKIDSFSKISIVSIFRNLKRQILCSFCITACIITMCIGFEGAATLTHPINWVYGERYRYDLMVRNLDGDSINEIKNNINGIEIFEPSIFFLGDVLGENVRVCTLEENSKLVFVSNKEGQYIYPKDGVIVDEMFAKEKNINVGDYIDLSGHSLKVTGIGREILFNVMYISMETASSIGYKEPNYVSIKASKEEDINRIKEEIYKLNTEAYFVDFIMQKDDINDGFQPMKLVMFLFSVLAFFIGSILILNISVIEYNENENKYATLRAMGTPIRKIIKVAIIQNLFRVILGIVISIPLTYLSVNGILSIISSRTQQYVMVDYIVHYGVSCLIPILYVVLGIVVTILKIKKLKLCSYLNEME